MRIETLYLCRVPWQGPVRAGEGEGESHRLSMAISVIKKFVIVLGKRRQGNKGAKSKVQNRSSGSGHFTPFRMAIIKGPRK